MSSLTRSVWVAIALVGMASSSGHAATTAILGSSFQVQNSGAASQRRIVGRAKERGSTDQVVGDPRVDGASLRIIISGGTGADETFDLPMGGWTAVGPLGYRFSNRYRGGAVRSAVIKRTPSGNFVIKILLTGHDAPLPIVPPNPGDQGGFILRLNGGDSYCVAFGGAAGGREVQDDASRWSMRRPTAEACPALGGSTSTSTTTSSTIGSTITTTTVVGATTTTTIAVTCGAPPPADPPLLPENDPFYDPPVPLLDPPGTVIRSRQVAISGLDPSFTTPFEAWQVMYASTDAKDQPAAAVATVIRPCTAAATSPRPLVSYQTAEDSCTMHCAPSYRLRLGTEKEAVSLPPLLSNGWMVVVPDYEGLLSAYTVGRQAARGVLDGIRAAENLGASFPEWGLTGAATPVGMWGYSGGGLATTWAAETATTYASELNIVGVSAGGVPPDIKAVADHLEGGPFSAIMLAGTVGMSQAYPEILALMKNDAATTAMRNFFLSNCIEQYLVSQYALQSLATYTTVADPLDYCCTGSGCTPQLCVPEILALNHLGHVCSTAPFQHCGTNGDCGGGGVCRIKVPTAPIYFFHAVLDELIPVEDLNQLVDQYCASGVTVQYYQDPASDHNSLAVSGAPGAVANLAARFAGQPPIDTCGLPTLP